MQRAALFLAAVVVAVACSAPTAAPTQPPLAEQTAAPSQRAVATVPLATIPPAALLRAMVVGPIQRLSERVGWVASAKGLSRTVDAGVTWLEIVVPSSRFTELRFINELRGWAVLVVEAGSARGADQPAGCAPASATTLCRSVVAITTDGGETWQERLSIPFTPNGPETIRGLQAIDMSTAWVVSQNAPCDRNGCPFELQGTTDGGRTWVAHRAATNAVARFASSQRGWLFFTMPASGSTVLVTSDGGTSWRTGLIAAPQQALALDAASSSVAWALTRDGAHCTASSCSAYELLTTTDGGAIWTSLGNPMTQATCSGGHLRGPLFASETIGWLGLGLGAGGANVGTGGLMSTRDGGRTWDCRTDPANVGAVSAADPRHVWASSDRRDGSAWLYQSDDGGDTWRRVR